MRLHYLNVILGLELTSTIYALPASDVRPLKSSLWWSEKSKPDFFNSGIDISAYEGKFELTIALYNIEATLTMENLLNFGKVVPFDSLFSETEARSIDCQGVKRRRLNSWDLGRKIIVSDDEDSD